MKDDIRLAILINSFNRLDLLREAIGSLLTHLEFVETCPAIFVFDAGSQDGSREFVHELASRDNGGATIALVDGRELIDRSFSAGVNCLADTAIARYPNVRYLFLFETDNYLKGADPVVRALKVLDSQKDLAAVGFTVVLHDGRPAGFGCPFPHVVDLLVGQQAAAALGLDQPRTRDKVQRSGELVYPDVVFTSPLLVKASAWRALGGMDSRRFPFSDCDLDLCWRWRKAGWRVGVIETDRVVHDNLGATSKWSETRTLHFHEARVKLLEIHRGFFFWLFYPLLLMRHVVELACLAAVSPFISSPIKRLKVRWSLISRCHRRYSGWLEGADT